MRNAITKATPMLVLLISVLFGLAGCQEQEPPQDSSTAAD